MRTIRGVENEERPKGFEPINTKKALFIKNPSTQFNTRKSIDNF